MLDLSAGMWYNRITSERSFFWSFSENAKVPLLLSQRREIRPVHRALLSAVCFPDFRSGKA